MHAVTGHHSGAADCRPDRGLGEPPRKDQQPAVFLELTPLVGVSFNKRGALGNTSALLVFCAGMCSHTGTSTTILDRLVALSGSSPRSIATAEVDF